MTETPRDQPPAPVLGPYESRSIYLPASLASLHEGPVGRERAAFWAAVHAAQHEVQR